MRVISNYQPRPQQTALHQRTERFQVDVLHRRFGKTVYALNKGLMVGFNCQLPNPRIHYCCPFRNQAKLVAWDYLKLFTENIPGVKYNISELRADFPSGLRFQLMGADRPDVFRGQYSDHFIFDETSQISPRMWTQVVRPALSDRKGSAHFIGTPMGKFNLFGDVWDDAATEPDWSRCLMTVKDTGLIDDLELEAARRAMSDEDFQQEFYCSWSAAIRGAYYGKEMATAETEGRIGRVPYDSALPVITSWDLGWSDSTAVWFLQTVAGEVRAIDYEEYEQTSLPEIVKKLREKPYVYDGHIGPHDLRVHELGSGQTRLEIASNLGLHFQVAKNIALMDGIDATRIMIKRMWFDQDKCKHGIEALRMYRSEYKDVERTLKKVPLHDWSSHAADSLRYFAVGMSGGNARSYGGAVNYDMLDRMAV